MKEIIKRCEKKFTYLKRKDLVKLRLRGQGSGHKEGPHKQGKFLPNQLTFQNPKKRCIYALVPKTNKFLNTLKNWSKNS